MANSRLLERIKVVPAFVPIDTTGAAQAGDYVNLKKHRRIVVAILQGAWAGGTPALTFLQATSAAGGSAKALGYTERFNGVALTTDTLTRVAVASDTSNLANVANSFVLVEFHVNDLDLNGGFQYLAVAVASPGSNADLIAGVYILGDPAVEQYPPNQPTVIT